MSINTIKPLVCMHNMDAWNEHEVTFAPAEGLDKNETTVRVLDQDEPAAKQREVQAERMFGHGADGATVRAFQDGLELEAEIRTDPGYKFLMMVSAFSARRLGKLVSSTGKGHQGAQDIDNICAVVAKPDKHWMQEPEISGVIYLSPIVYGHIKEAQTILGNGFARVPLKTLVESPDYAILFARLVAIRMALSTILTFSRQDIRDRTFSRLHQEQSAVLRQLRRVGTATTYAEWTRPAR